MQTMNGNLWIRPIKQGMMAVEGNEYEVIDAPSHGDSDPGTTGFRLYNPGDIVVVEDHLVIKVTIKGKEEFFVKEENVLSRIPKDGCSSDCHCSST